MHNFIFHLIQFPWRNPLPLRWKTWFDCICYICFGTNQNYHITQFLVFSNFSTNHGNGQTTWEQIQWEFTNFFSDKLHTIRISMASCYELNLHIKCFASVFIFFFIQASFLLFSRLRHLYSHVHWTFALWFNLIIIIILFMVFCLSLSANAVSMACIIFAWRF